MTTYPLHTGEQLSAHLRSLRKRLNLTQAELGRRLGVAQARIGKIERNPGSISVDQLIEVLAALDAGLLLDYRDADARVTANTAKVEW